MKQAILQSVAVVVGYQTAHAHCDVPCGIYDPHGAIIGALTTIRMIDIIKEIKDGHGVNDQMHDIVRAVNVKEQHADLCKKEIATIWGDYFKAEMTEQYPDLHNLVHSILQAASKAKQSENREHAEKLLDLVNQFAEIFWKTKGKETKRVKAPYKPESEIVIPIL